MKSDSFKQCIWSYIVAMAEGKTMEQCGAILRQAYAARKNESFVYQYNLDRLLLRTSVAGASIELFNRLGGGWTFNKSVVRTHAKVGSECAWVLFDSPAAWISVKAGTPDGVSNVFALACQALADTRKVDVLFDNGQATQLTLH